MRWNWYMPMTEAQFEKLKAGLKSHFRFSLNFATETVWYNAETQILTVYVSKGIKQEIRDLLSVYVNGFSQAIS